MDVPLGDEEVVGRVGGDVRDPGRVADDGDVAASPAIADVPLVCGHARAVTHTRRPADRDDRHKHDHEQHARRLA